MKMLSLSFFITLIIAGMFMCFAAHNMVGVIPIVLGSLAALFILKK